MNRHPAPIIVELAANAPAATLAAAEAAVRVLAPLAAIELVRVRAMTLPRGEPVRIRGAFIAWDAPALTQPQLDTTSTAGRLVFTILAAVAEMARELIADRVREGMRHAAQPGARIGRPPVTARPGFAARWTRVQADLAAGRLSRRPAARRLGIGTATLARLLAADRGTGGPADG